MLPPLNPPTLTELSQQTAIIDELDRLRKLTNEQDRRIKELERKIVGKQ